VVALLILAALSAWIASRVLAAAGFTALLAWGLVGVAVATPQTLVATAALFAAFLPIVEMTVRASRSKRPNAVLFG
jgi:hypothetical protein